MRSNVFSLLFPFVLCIVSVTSNLYGQNQTLKEKLIKQIPADSLTFSNIEEELIYRSLSGPAFNASKQMDILNEYTLKKAKSSWLNLLTISLNYNETTFLADSDPNAGFYYPKYFFGLTIPLGIFLTKPIEVKSAREMIKLGEENQAKLGRELKQNVLSSFYQYKAYDQLLLIQSQIIDDDYASLLQSEKNFKDGKITLEQYNLMSKNYNAETVKKINLKLQQDLVKLEIEKWIGVSLDTVMARYEKGKN